MSVIQQAGDAKSAKDAGIDFIYAEYGFGDVSKDSYVAKIESFAELAEIL
jgi:phosphoglycolate phosphatase